MFIVRSSRLSDLDQLFDLSGLVFFINLPADREIIEKILISSEKSFINPSDDFSKNKYVFVLEDTETKKIIGVSLIHAQHGNQDEPHFFLRVSQEYKFSHTINTGFIHGMLKLGLDFDGPTEIGALVLHPSYRGSTEKFGKFLSFSRFLYMGMNPQRFKPVIHAELMPPLDKDGNSPLWEAIGRRFMNMNYYEADKLSRTNKEFILNLFPSENIYTTLLPIEARNSIGKVGDETAPVKKMLETIGFKYINEVDPFDGGPHYRCNLKDISLIKDLKSGPIKQGTEKEAYLQTALFSTLSTDSHFTCFKSSYTLDNEKNLILPSDIFHELNLAENTKVTFFNV